MWQYCHFVAPSFKLELARFSVLLRIQDGAECGKITLHKRCSKHPCFISISFVWECQEREKNVGATSSYKCCLLNQLYDQQSMSYPHKLRPNYEGVRGVRIWDKEGSNLKTNISSSHF